MDAQSPSKRFTRGIPLHVENSVERPSFSLGLTQDFGEVAGSMSKSNAMQEIKFKLKNNPIRLEEMSAKSKQSNIKIVEGGKKDQSVAGSSKRRKEKTTSYTEENAKRKEVVVSGLLEHDEAVKFLGTREPTRIPHMQCYTNIEVMKVLVTKLTSSQYKEFCGTTCFAQLSSIRRCHVQAQLIRCKFLREIEGSSKDAILIHVNGTTLQFTIRDFTIITGLKCSANEKDFVFNTEEPNKIILQYFGVKKAITKSQLVENDCGLYVAAYADPISNGNGVPNSFDSEFTCIQYASLLWNYVVQKIQADAISDSEAPERPIRIHRDCDSSEKITIN
ncbi:hypothetical protein H5410_030009 [Solanum commersonii]|uniref:DUF1985 domain-containing protein n=1 Tax=Solanum commersonii TaxID=4109 RepID=A0A9J5YFP0_SOLCO|nr:hypothetical protein H5410_030009 [Solanum commersonii]